MAGGDASRSALSLDHPVGEEIVARALTILAATLAPVLLAPIAHSLWRGGYNAVAFLGAMEVAIAVTLLLNRAGQTKLAARLFTLGAWTTTFCLAAFSGEGTRDVVLVALAPVLLAAGVLAGRRFMWALTALTIGALILLWIAERRGWIEHAFAGSTDFTALIDITVILIMTAAATGVLTGDFRRALERERRNAEALERSELRFRTAIELAADGILLADEAGHVTETNSRLCELLARRRTEVIGASAFALLAPEDCETSTMGRERLDRGEVVVCERTFPREGHADVVVETTWQRLPDRTIQCFARDISARRRLEEQLRHAQKMEAVGALAGGIAHDFNNLLTVMKGFLELIEGDPALTAELASHVAELKNASTHAADLTQQLLTFAGRRPLQLRPVDLRELLTANQRLLARLTGSRIEVVIEQGDTPCPASVDPALIAQVLFNLAANARDAMPEGGRLAFATLNPAQRTPPHFAPAARAGLHVGIRATDTGVGMDAATIAHIFEPFFTTKETGHGTGLGLAMVQGIVERHGGWVEVVSAPGRGTEFLLFLPVHTGDTEEIRPPAPEPAPHRTILVVDDDPGVRRLARQALEPRGHTILEADTGPDAIESWNEHGGRVDLVFTDMVMPGGMTGLQLIAVCRVRQPDIAAILTSGYTLPAIDASIAGPGGIVLLPKPYGSDDLARMIDVVLAGGRPGA